MTKYKMTKNRIIQCAECKGYFDVLEEGLQRIELAKEKGWGMMLFNCPKCGEQTSWHRLKEMYSDTTLLNIEKVNKPVVEIDNTLFPKGYFDFLLNNKNSKIRVSKNRDEFNLFTAEELFTTISVDKKEYLTVYQLQGYFNTLLEVGYEFTKKEIELFENSLSIGDENGDILFIDKRLDNSNLYIFYPDGGDTKKTKTLFNDIMKTGK